MTKKAPAKTAAKPAEKKPPKALTPWERWKQRKEAMAELSEFIATRGSSGHLAAFCKAKDFNYFTVRSWIEADADRIAMYAQAREDRADTIADEIVGISDEAQVENVYGDDGEVVEVKMDATAIARNRLRVDARKWAASKLKPRVYGERTTIAGDEKSPLTVVIQRLTAG